MRKPYDYETVMKWQEVFDKEAEDGAKVEPRFREARVENGFTQGEIADILSVTEVTVYQWESGAKYPRIPHLIQLSRVYGKPVDYLIGL